MKIIISIIWYITGIIGFIYWWTKEHDLDLGTLIFLGLFVGISGPFAFIAGFFIHGNTDKINITIIKRKK